MKPNPPTPKASEIPASKLILRFSLIAGIVIFLHALFLFVLPGRLKPSFIFDRNWGFDSLLYYSWGWRIAAYAIAFALVFPAINALARKIGSLIIRSVATIPKRWLFIIMSIAAFPLFLLLRCKYAFLGDSFLRISNIEHGYILPHDPGTMIALRYFFLAMHLVFHMDARSALVLSTALCGSLYVYLALRIASLLGKNSFQKISLFCAFATTPLLQHFFGYIEIMAPLIVLLMASLYATILHLKKKVSVFLPIMALVLSVFSSVLAVLAIPPFIFLLYAQSARNRPILKNRSLLLAAMLAISAVAIACYFQITGKTSDIVYPLSLKPGFSMTLFSIRHIWEFLNGETLALGIGIVGIPLLLVVAAVKRFRFDLTTAYLLTGACSVGAGLFVLNECLGSADWDVYSIIAVFGQPLLIYLFLQLFDRENTRAAAHHGMLILLALLAIPTGLWIVVNATDRSIGRFERILMHDPAAFYCDRSAPVCIALSFDLNKLDNFALSMYERAYVACPMDPRVAYNLGCRFHKNLRSREAIVVWKKMFLDFPESSLPLKPLYYFYYQNNDTPMECSVGQRLFDLHRKKPREVLSTFSKQDLMDGLALYCNNLVTKNRWAEAIPVCSTLVTDDGVKQPYRYIQAYTLLMLGRYDECLAACTDASKRWPDYQAIRPIAATAEARLKVMKGQLTSMGAGRNR